MTKKDKNLQTTTSQEGEPATTGNQCSNSGFKGLSSLDERGKAITATWIKHRHPMFEQDVNDSLICQMYQVSFLKEKVKTSELITALTNCKELMQPCKLADVQIMLETVCSTFSCAAPNELGLQTYWELLKKYPGALFPYATLHICSTYKWPRLPLPNEFIEYLDHEVKRCHDFIRNLENSAEWALQLEQTSYKIGD